MSGSRLGNELIHMLGEPDPAKGIRRLEEFRLAPFIHSQLHAKPRIQKTFDSVDTILTWFTVEHPDTTIKRWAGVQLGLVRIARERRSYENLETFGLSSTTYSKFQENTCLSNRPLLEP